MKEAISIVIPVFNVKEYLPDCSESLLGQTFEMWNAILIDDGSTGGSDEICERYCTVDKRFHYFDRKMQAFLLQETLEKKNVLESTPFLWMRMIPFYLIH